MVRGMVISPCCTLYRPHRLQQHAKSPRSASNSPASFSGAQRHGIAMAAGLSGSLASGVALSKTLSKAVEEVYR